MKLLFALLITTTFVNAQNYSEVFVDQSWLQEHMEDENLVLLHVDRPEDYNRGHINGSIFTGNESFIITSHDSLYYELPEAEDFATQLAFRGIDKNSTIILVSGRESFARAFRLYFTMQYFGLDKQVRILDGGIKGWEYNKLPISQDSVVSSKATSILKLKPNVALLVDKNWVKDHTSDANTFIIDARRDAYYSGETKGSYLRGGHISSAKNITWTNLVDENNFLKSQDELATLYQEAGATEDKQLVSYCHVGLRASVVYTIGHVLGYNIKLYDGSFNEWDRQTEEYPFELGN